MLQPQLLCLDGCILSNWLQRRRRLHLLHHSQFQTPDLVLNVLVVFLSLAVLDHLGHEGLQLSILNGLSVLHLALGNLVMWITTCLVIVVCHHSFFCCSLVVLLADYFSSVNLL